MQTMMDSTGEKVVRAVAHGCTGPLRSEVARLVQGADSRLMRYGHERAEISLIAGALAQSDEKLAATMREMSEQMREAAVRQLDDALAIDGCDSIERMAAANFRREAARVIELIDLPQLIA